MKKLMMIVSALCAVGGALAMAAMMIACVIGAADIVRMFPAMAACGCLVFAAGAVRLVQNLTK